MRLGFTQHDWCIYTCAQLFPSISLFFAMREGILYINILLLTITVWRRGFFLILSFPLHRQSHWRASAPSILTTKPDIRHNLGGLMQYVCGMTLAPLHLHEYLKARPFLSQSCIYSACTLMCTDGVNLLLSNSP